MPTSSSTTTAGIFPCHPLGYVRHWLVTGPHEIPYQGPPAEESALRRDALDRTRVLPPLSASLHAQGPFDEPWRFYYPGRNFFVEHSTFYSVLTAVDSYAFTEIECA